MKQLYLIVLGIGIVFSAFSQTQKKTESSSQKSDSWKSGTFNGLKFRSIGPVLTSGRVLDCAVNQFPCDRAAAEDNQATQAARALGTLLLCPGIFHDQQRERVA